MATNLFHIGSTAAVGNRRPGFGRMAYLARKSDFETMAAPSGTTGAASKTITADHTFAAGKGFYQVWTKDNTLKADGASVGEPQAMQMSFKPEVQVMGDDAALQAMMEELIAGDDYILLTQAPECGTDVYYQYGGACSPCIVTAVENTTGTFKEGSKSWKLTLETNQRFFYSGTITQATVTP